MFYVEEIAMVKSADENSYTIDTNNRSEVESIMVDIYNENPSYWPEGLDVKGHDDLYMVRSASTDEPAGFVGWQMRKEGSDRVGYYTIGILPSFRRQGLAKEAVAKLISKKADEVDIVRAFIAPHNTPSIGLAEDLGVDVVKEAAWRAPLAGGLGNAAFWDLNNNGEKLPFAGKWDKHRLLQTGLNSGLGALGGSLIKNKRYVEGMGTLAMTPAKDLIMGAIPATEHLPKAVERYSAGGSGMSKGERLAMLGLGGAGLTAGAIGGAALLKRFRGIEEAMEQSTGGRMQVTLPTKDPDDRETTIDIPFAEVGVSQSARTKLRRDLRRRVNKETKGRTIKRKKKPSKESKPVEEKKASLMPVGSSSINTLKSLINTLYK